MFISNIFSYMQIPKSKQHLFKNRCSIFWFKKDSRVSYD